ncbi:MAG: dienelactone hydrolase family protein [Candidatus Limnocylindria bacterium]
MRGRGILLLLAAAIVVTVVVEPARVTVQTLALLPNLLDSGPRPLDWFSGEPTRITLPYRSVAAAAGLAPAEAAGDLADLWLPQGASAEHRFGAMLLVFGVNNLGRSHPEVERVAEALARTGVVVLVPDSATLLAGRLEVNEIDGIVRAFELLASRPGVDSGRIGIIGFSVGGSLALIAATDPRIAHEVRYVNAFGAYADARTYLASVAAHAYRLDAAEVDWQPSDLTLEVCSRFLLEQITDADDRAALADAYQASLLAGERLEADPELARRLGGTGRRVYDLVTTRSLDEATGAVERLPSSTLRFLDAISPSGQLESLQADVYLMHDVADHHVPYVESRALAEPLSARQSLARHTEFRLFDHVQPDDVDLVAAAPELWKLLWHVQAVMVETL